MKRLEAIFSVLSPCGLFVDVGSDHGLIARFMAGKAQKVIAADISDRCLQKARTLLKDIENVEFCVCDGLESVRERADIAAICGMGGYNVIGILKKTPAPLKPQKIVVQPQTEAPLVRRYLAENGYEITHDFTAFEDNHFYDIIAAEYTLPQIEKLDEMQLTFGKFYKAKDEILQARLEKLQEKYQGFKQTAQNKEMLEKIGEAMNWQR